MTRSLAARGADLICVPTASMVEYNDVQRVLLPSGLWRTRSSRLRQLHRHRRRPDVRRAQRHTRPRRCAVTTNPGVADLVTATLVRADIEHSRSQFCYLDDRNPDVY